MNDSTPKPLTQKDPGDALVGRTIGERYALNKLLGKGGFGAVYLAKHLHTGQDVVIKILHAHMAQDPLQVKRFFNEAKAACQLSHPHTVRVFDFGTTSDNLLYMGMELLNGKEFTDVIKAEAPLDPFRVIHIAIGVLKGLAEAHQAGLVHRDLKPGNIFLCDVHGEPDFVKIIDFGIAKSFEGEDEEQDLTKTGIAIGTPKYMSPEQGRAEPLDGRSDLYALGVILFEAVTGRVPFTAKSALSLIVKHLQEPPPKLSDVTDKPMPEGLEEVVHRALAKQPGDRFVDADDMRAELENVLERSGRAVSSRGRAVSAKFRQLSPEAIAAATKTAAAPTIAIDTGPTRSPNSSQVSAAIAEAASAETVYVDTGPQAAIDAKARAGQATIMTDAPAALSGAQGATTAGAGRWIAAAVLVAAVSAGGAWWWSTSQTSANAALASASTAGPARPEAVVANPAATKGAQVAPVAKPAAAKGAAVAEPAARAAKPVKPDKPVAAPEAKPPTADAVVAALKRRGALIRACVESAWDRKTAVSELELTLKVSNAGVIEEVIEASSGGGRALICLQALKGAVATPSGQARVVASAEMRTVELKVKLPVDPPLKPAARPKRAKRIKRVKKPNKPKQFNGDEAL